MLVGSGMLFAKISVRCPKATSCLTPTLANGVLGCGFCRALVRSLTASMAASTEDMVNIV